MVSTELTPKFDDAQSFYGKAKVVTKGDCATLFSYDTDVACIRMPGAVCKKPVLLRAEFNHSATTTRHVREFIKQYAPEEWEKLKDQIGPGSKGITSQQYKAGKMVQAERHHYRQDGTER